MPIPAQSRHLPFAKSRNAVASDGGKNILNFAPPQPPAALKNIVPATPVPAGKILRFAVLLLLGASAAHAHDPFESTTNIWLRPAQMEVDLIMARSLSRLFMDHPPTAPLTDVNFENLYHAPLSKIAPALLEIALDGQRLEPSYIEVSLENETDLQIKYVYARPPGGVLRVTTHFLQKLDVGYMNSVVVNDEQKFLGADEETVDNPSWQIILAKTMAPQSPPTVQQPIAASQIAAHPVRPSAYTGYSYAVIAVIILLAGWCVRQKFSTLII